jgi:hypothetical protein
MMNSESKFTLKVGHDRYNNLIIKELSVKADSVDELIEKTKAALEEFNAMKTEQMLGE